MELQELLKKFKKEIFYIKIININQKKIFNNIKNFLDSKFKIMMC